MKRRSKEGAGSVRARNHKAEIRGARGSSKGVRPHGVATADDKPEVARLTGELSEARQLQAASADVLRVISTSPKDVQPVFDIIAQSAVRLCQGQFSFVLRFDNDLLHFGACHGLTSEGLEAFRRELPRPPGDDTASGRSILHRAVVQIPDVQVDPTYGTLGLAQAVTYKSILAVPMLREGRPIGTIAVARGKVGIFTAGQIALLQTFADQAVIAIENTRLFEAEQQRTRELSESLQQQTATADVLKVISRSTFDLKTVLTTLTESAAQLCAADLGTIFQQDGDVLRLVANFGISREAERYFVEHPRPVDRSGTTGRALLEGRAIHIPDVLADPDYRVTRHQELIGHRTTLAMPLLRDGTTIGVFALGRREPNPFTGKQIELVTTFADQAVIAIENARLLNELRESLQQQTATADVLKVISSSAFDLQMVLDTLVESAAQLCAADHAWLYRRNGEFYRYAASYGHSKEDHERIKRYTLSLALSPGPGSLVGRAALEARPIQIVDVLADPEYTLLEVQRISDYRAGLGVPLLREGTSIGVLVLTRSEPQPFTGKQIELLTTFADQAVIAIENARLLQAEQQRTRELTESLEQQTATSEVLKVISSSPGDLQPVFAAMLENAVRICDAKFGNIYRRDGDEFQLVATHNAPPGYAEARRRLPEHGLNPQSVLGRVVAVKAVVHVVDASLDRGYIEQRVPELVLSGRGRRSADGSGCPHAERERTDRRAHPMSPGSSSLHGQADRVGTKLRRSSGHRH